MVTRRLMTCGVMAVALAQGDGCEPKKAEREARPVEAVTTDSVLTGGFEGRIMTVEHDGHKFVLWQQNTGTNASGSMIHHPGCTCQRGEAMRGQ